MLKILSIVTYCIILLITITDPAYSQWIKSTEENVLGGFNTFIISGDTLLAANHGAGIYRTTDSGTTWHDVNVGLTYQNVQAMTKTNSYLFAGCIDQIGHVFRSNNGGETWSEADKGLVCDAVYELAVQYSDDDSNKTYLFAGTNKGIFRSTNDGSDWMQSDSSLTNKGLNCFGLYNSTILCGASDGKILRSLDNGKSWDSTMSVPNAIGISCIAQIGKNLFVGTGNGVFVSLNSGESWEPVDIGVPHFSTLAIASTIILGDTLIAISTWTSAIQSSASIAFSKDNGKNWVDIRKNLPLEDYYSLEFFKGYLFIGLGGYGIWKHPISGIIEPASVQNSDTKYLDFSLSQNYPNPFNPTTNISFNIPASSFVSLKVFDVIGREVATIFSGELSSGSHIKQWNAKNLSSGIYFYRLQANSYSETKKLVFLR